MILRYHVIKGPSKIINFGGQRSYCNGNINSFINAYINPSEKAKLTTSISNVERFSKLGIPIYNSEVPEKMGRKSGEGVREEVN